MQRLAEVISQKYQLCLGLRHRAIFVTRHETGRWLWLCSLFHPEAVKLGPKRYIFCSQFCCKHVKVVPRVLFINTLCLGSQKTSHLGASQSFWSFSFEYVAVLQIVPWTRIPMAFTSLTRLSSFSKYYFFSQAWKVLEVEAYQEIQKQRWTQCITVTVILVYESCFWKRLRNLPRDSLSHNLSLQVDSTRNLTKELIKQSWFLSFSSLCIYFHKWNGFQSLESILCPPDQNHPLYGSNTLLSVLLHQNTNTRSEMIYHRIMEVGRDFGGPWSNPMANQAILVWATP